jgi:Resolvase, N terminal domain
MKSASRPTEPVLQPAALKKAGRQTVFKDGGISGATTTRPALLRYLKTLDPGDSLIVWKLDGLSRSLCTLLRCSISMLAELERRLTSESTRFTYTNSTSDQPRDPMVGSPSSFLQYYSVAAFTLVAILRPFK